MTIYEPYEFLGWIKAIWLWLAIFTILTCIIVGMGYNYVKETIINWLDEKIALIKNYIVENYDYNFVD